MINVNATRALFYGGLAGAICIIAYGFAMLVPARHAPATQAPPQAPVQASHAAVIARHLIRRGTTITAMDLDLLPLAAPLPADVQPAVAAIIGKTATADIPATQFVLASQVSADPAQAGLATLIPAGMRAIELNINDEIAVGTLIRPGDHVDVQQVLPDSVMPGDDAAHRAQGNLGEAHTLLQNVIVLALGPQLMGDTAPDADPNRKADRPTGVTLAMTPDQLSQFVLARGIGTLYLALRNPTDPQIVTHDTAVLRDIRGQTEPATDGLAQGHRPIELITGNQRKTIYSLSSGGAK